MNSKNWEIIGSDIKTLQELIDKLEVQKKKDEEQNDNSINTSNTIIDKNDNKTKNISNQVENNIEVNQINLIKKCKLVISEIKNKFFIFFL